MTEQRKEYLEEAKTHMAGAISFLEKELNKIRAGKASPAMVESIKVDYYGTPTPVSQIANIATPDPRCIVIQPWEKNMLSPIDKAIQAANLGFNPQHEGDTLRILIPALTEERRKELVKSIRSEGENAKVHIRNSRRNIMDKIKKLKDAGFSEDQIKTLEKEIQDLTDKYIAEVDVHAGKKEKEIMTI